MRKLVIKSLLEVNGRDPGGPGLPLQPPQPSLSFPTGRAWQSWRTRCSRTPWCCGKYLLLVPVPFLPLPVTLPHPCRRDAGGMREAAAHHQSIWSSQPQAPHPHLRPLPPAACLPHHPEFFFAVSPQGPAGKDGEAGAQGPPGPAVSVPDREIWGGGTVEQERETLPPSSPGPSHDPSSLCDRAPLVREVNKVLLAPQDSR